MVATWRGQEDVVQGLFVRAAHIHARAAADGLQPLQNLDVLRRIATALAALGDGGIAGEQVIVGVCFFLG